MKKELQKATLAWAVASVLACGSQLSQAQLSSTEGAHSATAKGRAVLTVEDLKTLLGLKTRDPSSASATHSQLNQDDSAGMYSLNIQLSSVERARLTKKVSEIEAAREQLVAKTDQEVAKKKTEIRAKRHKIQSSRTSSAGVSELAASKKLFESLIQEGNLETIKARKLAEFNSANVFVVEFEDSISGREVQSISVGQSKVWTNSSHAKVAAR